MDMNEIANCANNRKKLSKSATWKEYKQLIKTLDNTDLVDGDAYQILINMYNYFQPATPSKPQTVNQWLSKALAGKNEFRGFLKNIHCSESTLVATDGHRMHICTNTLLAGGYYDKNLQKIEESATYPDFKQIMPSNKSGNHITSTNKTDLLANVVQLVAGGKEAINVINEVWVTKKYLVDALSFFKPDDILELIFSSSQDCIEISAYNCIAVITPINIGKTTPRFNSKRWSKYYVRKNNQH